MRHIAPDASQDNGFRFSMPAPVGGWNARDNIAAMPATDALVMDNWWPTATAVEIRPGKEEAASITAGQSIKSLIPFANGNGSTKRFAASQTGIWDVSTSVGVLDSGATTAFWEHVQLTVGGVSYLWCCAGDATNKARIYNGTTDAWTLLDGASVPALTGVTSADVTNVSKFKNRLILCVKDSLNFYYGPLNSVAGAFSAFEMGSVFQKGGYLVATGTWSIDAGDGLDDYFLAITSEGEMAVFRGTDPSSVNTFALVGVFEVGRPTGKRCLIKLAGDVGVLTEQGLWPVSKALLSATVDKRIALTDKVQKAFTYYHSLYGNVYGWQSVLLPKGPAILVNVPLSETLSYQFVMNTQTGAWTRFKAWNAKAMMVLAGRLYYAIGNKVYEGWTGLADDAASITCTAATAFSYGPTRARGKKINMVKPVIQATASLGVAMALDTDFRQRTTMPAAIASSVTGDSVWDTAVWGASNWADGSALVNKWKTVRHKPGGAFSLRLQTQTKGISAAWASTDFLGEIGNLTT